MGEIGGARKSRVLNGSIEALVAVDSLEVSLQVAPCLVGCRLLVPFFARCHEVPRCLNGIVAHAGLFVWRDGVATCFEGGITFLDLLELYFDRIKKVPRAPSSVTC